MEEPEPTFETALTALERIVADLETGAPALSVALAKYEQGVRLLARCQGLLDGAERTVALLAGVADDGTPELAPFDATATVERDRPEVARPARKLKPKPVVPDDGIPF